jgi:uncharacterized membrane protein YfcA
MYGNREISGRCVELLIFAGLILLGFAVGAFGTLIGAGGGFILMPILLILYPDESPNILTCISLAVVFFNALSGSSAYVKMKRVDYKSGIIFSLATIPGAIIGALSTSYIPRRLFDGVFGVILIAVSIYLFIQPGGTGEEKEKSKCSGLCTREVVDAEGNVHTYSYNMISGVLISMIVGYLSSVLGIGGGIIHVPALVRILNFPVHIATATSHFILAVMAFVGTVVHIASGTFTHGLRRTICLSLGVLIGAQLGALLSKRIRGIWLIRSLAVALFFVGIRIFIMAVW